MNSRLQDDYVDCFGDPAVTGKSILNDLAEGKCTWISCTALQQLHLPEHAALLPKFEAHFGSPAPEDIQACLSILRTLNMTALYEQYERTEAECMRNLIAELNCEQIRPVLEDSLEFVLRISKRFRP